MEACANLVVQPRSRQDCLKGQEQAPCDVYVVRHGERLDEVAGKERDRWMKTCGNRNFDPPLTKRGKEQALSSARLLRAKLGGLEAPFDVIHSSPLERCVSTAEAFAEVFQVPIRVVNGLGECCAALRATNKQAERRWGHVMTKREHEQLCPAAAFVEPDPVSDDYISAAATCAGRLAKGRERVLVVTHREGIRNLASQRASVSGHVNTPYAGIGHFIVCRRAGSRGEAWTFRGILRGERADGAEAAGDDLAESELS